MRASGAGGLDLLPRAPAIEGLTVLEAVDSTNQWLLDSIDAEGAAAVHDAAVTAELQSLGRGRRGRRWASPFGRNLYLSIAWNWAAPVPRLRGLSLAVGVAVAETIEALTGLAAQLKWPNDVYLDGAKVAGILVETRTVDAALAVVVGVGLNVHGLPSVQAGAVEQAWIPLVARAPGVRREPFLAALVPALRGALARHRDEGLSADVRRGFSARDLTLGQWVTGLAEGRTVEGIGRGVAADGTLAVATDAGLVHLEAGEVSLRLAGVRP